MRNMAVLLTLSMTFLSGACLSQSHRISKGELRNLTTVAPEQRGEKVRVVQNLGHHDDPPEAGHVNGGTVVYVHSPIWVGGRPHRHDHRSAGAGAGGVGGKSSGKTGGGFGNLAAVKKDEGKAWIILAAVAAGALAATEGARYDGWVKLHPMHPVHLYGPYGEYTVMPLAHIDDRTASWAHHAVVREGEGPWTRLGRAPLNRRGFSYSVLLGAGDIPVTDFDADTGFLGHIQFGYFPTKQIGLHLDIGLGWTEDASNNTIYTSRTAFELQAFPVKAGPVHAGLFGQIGAASRFDDGIGLDDNSNLFGAGALLQLDWTTRLAVTGRLGSTRSFGEWANELTVGLSIY